MRSSNSKLGRHRCLPGNDVDAHTINPSGRLGLVQPALELVGDAVLENEQLSWANTADISRRRSSSSIAWPKTGGSVRCRGGRAPRADEIATGIVPPHGSPMPRASRSARAGCPGAYSCARLPLLVQLAERPAAGARHVARVGPALARHRQAGNQPVAAPIRASKRTPMRVANA